MAIAPTYRGLDPDSANGYLLVAGGRGGPGLRRIESAAVAAVLVVMSLGAWWWTSLPADSSGAPLEAAAASVTTSTERAVLVVHVAGQVRRPGVVRLPAGSRVVDAIEAAGGATPSAVLAGVNLAAGLVDGSQIVVPAVDDGREPVDDGIVAINTATAAELEVLPGVGPVLAGRIVAHRDTNGSFETVEDLLDVSGIGEAILSHIRPFVRVP